MRLLDLFCGAGGAAEGYKRAGFDEIVGVDIKPQPRYPFIFHEAEALTVLSALTAGGLLYVGRRVFSLRDFAAIHASPPCQGYSRLRHLPWLKSRNYPMLIDATRALLSQTDRPWIIENVEDAPLNGFVVCGLNVGLPISRHRAFEGRDMMLAPPCPGHEVIEPGRATLGKRYNHSGKITGVLKEVSRDSIAGHFAGVDRARKALDIPWMNRDELAQAIPPAYTEFIGKQLVAAISAQSPHNPTTPDSASRRDDS